ncbi:mycothione reductase [Corynebacterium heidelbergense]|uniref:mycothione reductase n=1 Tax=Corynebacterium heidelbergense TaxID=2055947 RepID=UPI003F6D3A04
MIPAPHAASSTAPEHFDIIIVGTGSGNSIPGQHFHHKRIAIVEESTFGGTCINVGCIPTKMFVHAADMAREFADSGRLSLHGSFDGVDWKHLQQRIFGQRIDPIAQSGEEYRRGSQTPNITLFSGRAAFVAPRTLQIGEGPIITGDNVVLATGGRPMIPRPIAESGVPYYTNDNVMRMERLPKSMIIVGAGIIAVEFAHVFSAFGTAVTVLARGENLLRKMDETLVDRFNSVADAQWETRRNTEIVSAREESGEIIATLSNGSDIRAEALLVATGRVNNSDRLNAPAGGVQLADDGRIITDEFGRTSDPAVFSLGDATNTFELKHVANAEARVVAHNLLHPQDFRRFNHDFVPSGIFTHPQIATVGMTEEEARSTASERKADVVVKVQEYSDVAYGWALEDTTGFCKIIADRNTGYILGAHIMGPQATTLIQELVTAMAFRLDYREVARGQYWPHPALTEVVENALLGLDEG